MATGGPPRRPWVRGRGSSSSRAEGPRRHTDRSINVTCVDRNGLRAELISESELAVRGPFSQALNDVYRKYRGVFRSDKGDWVLPVDSYRVSALLL